MKGRNTVRTSSNPVFRNLPKQGGGGYATFGTATAGASQAAQQFGQPATAADPYRTGPTSRSMTIDDVVTKTGITLGVLAITAIVSYLLVDNNGDLAVPFVVGGGLIGLVLVLVAVFGKKMDNKALVLAYAVAEGFFLGALSFMFTDISFGGAGGSTLIAQAVLGTFGVFFGMLVVYKTGAIRVTPKFTRFIVAAMFGALALMLLNLVLALFGVGGGEGFGLRSGGPLAIIFSLVVIGIAAFSFLIDFDAADQMVRAGAPEKAAWGIALGLTVTLVWLYVEILRLLSYFNQD